VRPIPQLGGASTIHAFRRRRLGWVKSGPTALSAAIVRFGRKQTRLGGFRIICSSLIAQAFDAVRYPILPQITRVESQTARREIAEIRHSSLYAPRDFDISPYFMVVKPTLARAFSYKSMHWIDLPHPAEVHTAQVTLTPEIEGAMAEAA
jgi:hypothetical protein